MYRVELVLGVVVAAVWIFSIVSCVLTPESEVRGIPKWGWLILIVLLPLLGSVLWLGVGRTGGARLPRPAQQRPPQHGRAPMSSGRDYASLSSDERIRRMEEDLARLERESEDPDQPAGGRPRA